MLASFGCSIGLDVVDEGSVEVQAEIAAHAATMGASAVAVSARLKVEVVHLPTSPRR